MPLVHTAVVEKELWEKEQGTSPTHMLFVRFSTALILLTTMGASPAPPAPPSTPPTPPLPPWPPGTINLMLKPLPVSLRTQDVAIVVIDGVGFVILARHGQNGLL
jgi:hypothetical protein